MGEDGFFMLDEFAGGDGFAGGGGSIDEFASGGDLEDEDEEGSLVEVLLGNRDHFSFLGWVFGR